MYISGFPEYFKINDESHTCIRWEKVTGRIDVATNGEWISGDNSCELGSGYREITVVSATFKIYINGQSRRRGWRNVYVSTNFSKPSS